MERRYVALLPANAECKKCSKISPKIAVNRGTIITLYCSSCGSFFKSCGSTEALSLYPKRIKIPDNIPQKLMDLIEESQRTMINI